MSSSSRDILETPFIESFASLINLAALCVMLSSVLLNLPVNLPSTTSNWPNESQDAPVVLSPKYQTASCVA